MNSLRHFQEFQDILARYTMSEHAKEVLNQIRLVLLVGPSSAGRNTIIKKLVETGAYQFVVSDTTRQKRVNNGIPEQNGVEYWFRTEEEILDDLRHGEFLEAAIIHNQQVSGISIRELERVRQADKIAINEVQIDGAANIHAAKPNTVIFFVVPPNFTVWMQRAQGRGELPPDEMRRRVEEARKEYVHALEHDFYIFIINDKLEEAVAEIDHIVRTGKHDTNRSVDGRQVTEQLLRDTDEYLRSSEYAG